MKILPVGAVLVVQSDEGSCSTNHGVLEPPLLLLTFDPDQKRVKTSLSLSSDSGVAAISTFSLSVISVIAWSPEAGMYFRSFPFSFRRSGRSS